jgi:hypothetical protein
MKDFFRNPHTFDMNNYYSGNTVEVGGRDFEKEDKEEGFIVKQPRPTKEISFEMDWSFLKQYPKTQTQKFKL